MRGSPDVSFVLPTSSLFPADSVGIGSGESGAFGIADKTARLIRIKRGIPMLFDPVDRIGPEEVMISSESSRFTHR